jgi:peptidoglycan/xylan/chitin deacetylase (PgdA/CDA1 family)
VSAPPSPAPPSRTLREAREQPGGLAPPVDAGTPRWERFAVAIGLTVVLVVALGLVPRELRGGGRSGQAGASEQTEGEGAAPASSATTTAPSTAPSSAPSTAGAPATTTTPPVPGLFLPRQPPPTPVSLPASGPARVFNRIPTTNKVIFLGIDDGVVRDPAVADALRDAHVPFTMFLVQGEAAEGAAYFRQLQQYGGTVEAHTITHPDLTKLSYSQMQREVCGTLDDYQSRFGRRPTLFRPPYGSTNANVQAVAGACGYKAIVLWKGSTNDGRVDLQDGTKFTPGDVLLLHFRYDLYRDLLKIFDLCRDQGFAIARLEDYLPSGT